MSPKRRARILALYDGKCYQCGVTERLEIDHAIALELGGADDDPNLVVLCVNCHATKTRLDAWRIAKARRLRLAADPETRKHTKRPIKGRGFDRGLRKKFDGTVERR